MSGAHLQQVEIATRDEVVPLVTKKQDFPDTDFLDSFVSPQVTRSKYPSLQDRHLFYASITPELAQKVVKYLEHTNGWTISDIGNLILALHFELSANGCLSLLTRIHNEKLIERNDPEEIKQVLQQLQTISSRTVKLVATTVDRFGKSKRA